MTRVLLVTCVVIAVMTQAGCGFDGHTEEVTSVAFSPDGQYLLTSGHDGTARLWDIKTGLEVRRFLGHDGLVLRARFTPDGHYVASCGSDSILIWNASNGTQAGRIKSYCLEISISDDSKRIAASDFDSVKVWDIASGNEIRSVEIGENDFVSSFEFLPDGQHLAFADDDDDDHVALNLLDINSGEVKRFALGSKRIERITPLRDSPLLILGDDAGYVHLWDLTQGKELNKFKVHENVQSIYPLPNADQVLSTSFHEFSIWSIKEAKVLRQFKGDALFTALSPDGRQVASVDMCNDSLKRLVDSTRNIRIWDLETGTTSLEIPYKCPFRVGID